MIRLWPAGILLFAAMQTHAHFMVALPSDALVQRGESNDLSLSVSFSHPFEQRRLDMAFPERVGVLAHGERADLSAALETVRVDETRSYRLEYRLSGPGDYVFYIEPTPYWEPAEDRFIAHYAKVIVNAYGVEEGWDKRVGLPAEIVPMTRPYGLWVGNLFTGQVLVDGKPGSNVRVEVTYENTGSRVKAPTGSHAVQVLKTDDRGIFSYAMPRAGWWGFAALSEADEKLTGPDGKAHPLELGAVVWVSVDDLE